MLFGLIGIVFVCLAIALWIKATPIVGNAAGDAPAVPSYTWGFLPLLVALWLFWVAAHCARHAYIIFTPLGIELFPFWRPTKNMNVIYWSEIANASVGDDLKTLTIDRDGGGGVVVALAPISPSQRPLLKRAIEGRVAGKA